MLYWIVWLATGIVFLCVFSSFVMPKIVKARANFKAAGRRDKYIWLTEFSLSCALEAGLLCIIIGEYASRAINGYPVGIQSNCVPNIWFVYVFAGVAAALFISGTLFIELRPGKKAFREYAPSHDGMRQKPVKKRNFTHLTVHILSVVLLSLSVLAASAILTLIANYILFVKFSLSASKKIILVAAVFEFIALVAAGIIARKKIKYLNFIIYAACVLLFCVFLGEYLLFVLAGREVVETILILAGTSLVVLTPLSAAVWILFVLGTRNRFNFATETPPAQSTKTKEER